jgi:hypothetical protein
MRKLLRACLYAVIAAGAGCGVDRDDAAIRVEPRTAGDRAAALPAPIRTAKATRIRLDGQFSTAVVAYRGADGKIATECVDGAQAGDAMQRAAELGVVRAARGEAK